MSPLTPSRGAQSRDKVVLQFILRHFQFPMPFLGLLDSICTTCPRAHQCTRHSEFFPKQIGITALLVLVCTFHPPTRSLLLLHVHAFLIPFGYNMLHTFEPRVLP